MNTFQNIITEGYNFSGKTISLGVATQNGEIFTQNLVKIPLSTLNRHGLIAGATGTGKTKTIQKFLEALSAEGVPTVMMDIKGDISGVAMPGQSSEKLQNYISRFGSDFSWTPK